MSIKHMYYRLYQGVFRIAVNFLDWTPPKIISGPGSVKKLPQVIKEKGLSKMMIVTDKGLTGLNLLDGLYEGLKADGIDYVVYDKTQPNPSIDNIEEVRKLYLDNGCQGFIAFGGGSPMDCAKGAAARVVCPNKTVQKMRGQLKYARSCLRSSRFPPPPAPAPRPLSPPLLPTPRPTRSMRSTIPCSVRSTQFSIPSLQSVFRPTSLRPQVWMH